MNIVNKLTQCSKIRQTQLTREEMIDKKIQSCSTISVMNYLITYRQWNRQLSSTLYNASIYDTPSILVNQLDQIDQHLTMVENCVCHELDEITNQLKELLKNKK